ncbi:hypothetical protein [Mesorhizobium sp. B2-3-4]|uniref:portal protein n=1 Tax=Mesorhizobium sp. B2-3-4 TaxID=2589959 RepID=UPI001128033F|nr:hypothetical protein [Mesorhizobium sp. B2-3-4]TPM41414.1 hypothetical protein FJ967_00305 [Mesorhizobium sp. B2-3-4]
MPDDKAPDSDKAILDKVKGQFEAAASSPVYQNWLREATEAYGFYESTGHWSAEELEKLAEMGVSAVTINKIAPRLNNVTGMEVQTRTKVTFRARSYDKNEKATAEALSDLAMFVQDKNNSTHILSEVGHDSRICGIGWHEFDVQDGVIVEARRSPMDQVFDPRDRTPGMTNQGFLSSLNWMPLDVAKAKFADVPNIDEILTPTAAWAFGVGGAFCDGFRLGSCGSYWDKQANEVLIIEHFYREPAKYYEVTTKANQLVNTFDKAEADKLARSPKDIAERNGFKVNIAYFTGDQLIKHIDDFYQLNPAKGLFMLTPTICYRENSSGQPYGLIRAARDAQRRYNKTKTRLGWLQAATQVIMEGDAVDQENARQEAARPDGVLLKKAGKELTLNRHEQAIAQHQQILVGDDKDIQDALGIYDESLGIETNANSGVAIQKRQTGSSRNMAMVIDNALAMKRGWAEKLLYLIQSVFTEQTALWVTDDQNEVKSLVLNEPLLDAQGKPIKDEHGKPIIKYDIKTGVYDVYVEEVPDVATQQEYARDLVVQALPSVGGMQGLTPGLLELLGVPQSAKIMEEVSQGLPQQMAARNAAADAAGQGITDRGGQVPPPPVTPGGGQPTLQPTTGQVG